MHEKQPVQESEPELQQAINEEDITATENSLVPTKIYLKSGIHIGTKFKTKYMEKFIYKIRPDGLCVLNLQKIDERLRVLANFLTQYNPEDMVIVCRRENGWKSVKAFHNATGIRVFAGRYPPGILTNPALETFMETKLMMVVDTWADRNAINDAMNMGIPIIALCDTNNQSNNIDLVIPCNNKGKKSLGLLFYVLAREYLLKKGMISSEAEMKYKLEDFEEE